MASQLKKSKKLLPAEGKNFFANGIKQGKQEEDLRKLQKCVPGKRL